MCKSKILRNEDYYNIIFNKWIDGRNIASIESHGAVNSFVLSPLSQIWTLTPTLPLKHVEFPNRLIRVEERNIWRRVTDPGEIDMQRRVVLLDEGT